MKRKLLKIAGITVLAVVVIVAGLMAYVKLALPDVGEAPDMKVEITPQRVERGRYLANHVTICTDCHSKRDWTKFSGPLVENTYGMGGEEFNRALGFPGVYYSRNITPAGIGDWTDGELFRAITSGVNKSGRALFPLMNHPAYGQMDEEDIKSIIAYVRTLKPIENTVPASSSDFPMNFIINTIPKKPSFKPIPDKSNPVLYGKYLVNAASCIECHSQSDKGNHIAGLEFAGGRAFPMPSGGVIRSANITPHPKTGIGKWSKETFIHRFKAYADSSAQNAELKQGEFNTIMPWTMYAGMTEEDLGAVYAYLHSLKPIDNSVVHFTKAPSNLSANAH